MSSRHLKPDRFSAAIRRCVRVPSSQARFASWLTKRRAGRRELAGPATKLGGEESLFGTKRAIVPEFNGLGESCHSPQGLTTPDLIGGPTWLFRTLSEWFSTGVGAQAPAPSERAFWLGLSTEQPRSTFRRSFLPRSCA